MDADKIIQDLERKFAAPLPEFYKRRIVVWHDEEREFEEQIDALSLSNAKILRLTGSNNFLAKKLLAVDDPASNYLIYCPLTYAGEEDNWLMDVELYSEEYRADQVSIWMDELNLPDTPGLRRAVREQRKFFNAKARREKLAALGAPPARPAQLQLAIMAVLSGVKDARPNAILRAVLRGGLDMARNPAWREFVSYDIAPAFWTMVGQGCGYREADGELFRLTAHLLLTAATRTLRMEAFEGQEALISTPHQAFCFDFISEWLHSGDAGQLRALATAVEEKLELPGRFMKMTVDELLETELFPCIDEVILVKLMDDVGDHIIDEALIIRSVERRQTCVWYDEYRNYYEGLLQLARMRAFFKKHEGGFHTAEPRRVWGEYTKEYFKMDRYYRLFHMRNAAIMNGYQNSYHEELFDRFGHVRERVEGLYIHWFLAKLGENWCNACRDELRERGYIQGVYRQEDFYERYIVRNEAKRNNARSDKKIYVIISDALRYEVAASLAEQLQRETQARVQLTGVQGIFPTVTKFGMAALLPHEKLSVELRGGRADRLAVLADGRSTEAGNREKILKAAEPQSVALRYRDIIGMKRPERKGLVKGMNVVYIYHDTIDAAGHENAGVFGACEQAIDELKNMVRIICNDCCGSNIVITSDHGFLYTYSPLNEDDKVDKTSESEQDVEIDRRYAIMQRGARPQYLLPVKFLDGNTPYDAFAPQEYIRIKKKGGGLNFVHGGISLQEMVVPVIEYHFLRNQIKEYQRNRSRYDTKPVEIELLSGSRKITNMIFSLEFYQRDVLGPNREKATYRLYFTDGAGRPVSDTVTLIADKTSGNGLERIFRPTFNLKQLKYGNTEQYYLCIADTDGNITAREEFQIDIPYSLDESDFFS